MNEICNSWETVDFGRGKVLIRCTITGKHTHHKCEVAWPAHAGRKDPVATVAEALSEFWEKPGVYGVEPDEQEQVAEVVIRALGRAGYEIGVRE